MKFYKNNRHVGEFDLWPENLLMTLQFDLEY